MRAERLGEIYASGLSFPGPIACVVDEALHAMAQPLTILQSCVLIARRPDLSHMISAEFVAEMADEVERATAMYRCLQRLVSIGAGAPQEEGELLQLLRGVLEERRPAMLKARISVELQVCTEARLMVREAHARQALAFLLEDCMEGCVEGGRIDIAVTGGGTEQRVDWRVEPARAGRPQGRNLHLSAADALLRVSGGELVRTAGGFEATAIFRSERQSGLI